MEIENLTKIYGKAINKRVWKKELLIRKRIFKNPISTIEQMGT